MCRFIKEIFQSEKTGLIISIIKYCTRGQFVNCPCSCRLTADKWRGAGVVERAGLENRCAERYPGFESLPLRHKDSFQRLAVSYELKNTKTAVKLKVRRLKF